MTDYYILGCNKDVKKFLHFVIVKKVLHESHKFRDFNFYGDHYDPVNPGAYLEMLKTTEPLKESQKNEFEKQFCIKLETSLGPLY